MKSKSTAKAKAKPATKTKTRARAKTKTTAKPTPPAKRGSIGQEIFAQVQKLVAEEKLSHAAAFKKLSEATGRQVAAISNAFYRLARKGGVAMRAKKGVSGTTRVTKPTTPPTPAKRGSIGQETYAQVQKLVADEQLSHAAAFKRLAETTGRSAGTIANTFYRIARTRGVPPAAERGAKRRGRPPVTPSGAVSGLLNQLAEIIRRQEQELEKLRKENARFAEVRKLLVS